MGACVDRHVLTRGGRGRGGGRSALGELQKPLGRVEHDAAARSVDFEHDALHERNERDLSGPDLDREQRTGRRALESRALRRAGVRRRPRRPSRGSRGRRRTPAARARRPPPPRRDLLRTASVRPRVRRSPRTPGAAARRGAATADSVSDRSSLPRFQTKTPPGARRSGKSVRIEAETSPASPCGRSTRATTRSSGRIRRIAPAGRAARVSRGRG